jgi:hypothetical protein
MVGLASLFDEPFQATASNEQVHHDDEQDRASSNDGTVKPSRPMGIGWKSKYSINEK